MKPTGNVIVDITFQFALNLIQYVEILESKRKFVIANQLLKSGTSIGANVRESQNGESKADFIHKLKVALKEADETEYWLLLCKYSNGYPDCEIFLKQLKRSKKFCQKLLLLPKEHMSINYLIV
jgi:four helix bundle protein